MLMPLMLLKKQKVKVAQDRLAKTGSQSDIYVCYRPWMCHSPPPPSLADNVLAAWAFFLVLTWVHVWANIRALRCLVLSSLNQPRLRLLLQHYMAQVGGPGGWAM